MSLLGGIGRHNRLKICRLLGVPVRVWQQAPYFLKEAMSKKSEKTFEQIELFSQLKPTQAQPAPKAELKKPFVPVHIMALDNAEIKHNFMYMMRILLNTHQRSLSQTDSQNLFIDSLINEIKIKKGLLEPDIAVRSCALKPLKK